jgi:CheY-like chemotaxis protein
MKVQEQVYKIFREVAMNAARESGANCSLPEKPDPTKTLCEYGISLDLMPDIQEEMTRRFKGRTVHLESFLNPQEFDFLTLDKVLASIIAALGSVDANPIIVYVDDEEDNLFVFNRKYGKRLNLKLFTNPAEALDYIRNSPSVALVITDEVMPNMNGNELCDQVQETNPQLPFILITGNPNQDSDLLYRSLRHGRFFEFIQKPIDLDTKGEEYFNLITRLIGKRAAA